MGEALVEKDRWVSVPGLPGSFFSHLPGNPSISNLRLDAYGWFWCHVSRAYPLTPWKLTKVRGVLVALFLLKGPPNDRFHVNRWEGKNQNTVVPTCLGLDRSAVRCFVACFRALCGAMALLMRRRWYDNTHKTKPALWMDEISSQALPKNPCKDAIPL